MKILSLFILIFTLNLQTLLANNKPPVYREQLPPMTPERIKAIQDLGLSVEEALDRKLLCPHRIKKIFSLGLNIDKLSAQEIRMFLRKECLRKRRLQRREKRKSTLERKHALKEIPTLKSQEAIKKV